MDKLYESWGAALLWLLMLPGVLPVFAAAVLVLGLKRARRVRRPARYRFGVIATAAALVCFHLFRLTPSAFMRAGSRRSGSGRLSAWPCRFLCWESV